MLHQSGLPEYLWEETLHHAVWLKNRSSTHMLGDVTPLEHLTGIKLNISGMPEWWQPVWVHIFKGLLLITSTPSRFSTRFEPQQHTIRYCVFAANSLSSLLSHFMCSTSLGKKMLLRTCFPAPSFRSLPVISPGLNFLPLYPLTLLPGDLCHPHNTLGSAPC
ncbi:hypothetical protein BGW80DRAFT_1189223 [Lactifluus volemus]|nr:hypothetical protein BGW80DRAFT_1189223 [Lactifluus volemus]